MAVPNFGGALPAFDPAEISLTAWCQLFDELCDEYGVEAEPAARAGAAPANNSRRRKFITCIGPRCYEILRSACLPARPNMKSIAELKAILRDRFEPEGMRSTHRFKFSQRVQKDNEGMHEFITSLQLMAEHCGFGLFLNDALKDRLIGGVKSDHLRRQLLAIPDLTWAGAKDLAMQEETVRLQARAIAGAAVNRISSYKRGKPSKNSAPKQQQQRNNQQGQRQQQGDEQQRFGPCRRCTRRHDSSTCQWWHGSIAQLMWLVLNWLGSLVTAPIRKAKCLFALHKRQEPIHVFVSVGQVVTSPPVIVPLKINSVLVNFELDTGASVTVISVDRFKSLFPHVKVSNSNLVLHALSGSIGNAGEASVSVECNNRVAQLDIVLCESQSDFTPLMGRNWLDVIKPGWRSVFIQQVHNVSTLAVPSVSELQQLYPRIFDVESDTCIVGFKARLVLKPDATPVFAKAYNLAFGLVEPVNQLLDQLVKSGKIVHVMQSYWASPGVVVQKKDKTIGLCVDFKRTLNPQLRVDHYPLPRPDDVFANMADGQYFTSLDLKDAYTQLELHPESMEYCVLNTHKGLFMYKRLIYGVASAAGIFQSVMDQILFGLKDVSCYLDNILVKGRNLSDCINKTMLVLSRLDKYNVRLRLDKCEWFVTELEYLGFVISKDGRRPSPTLYDDIMSKPAPTDASLVRTFLGIINFYSEFLPMFSTVAKPLRVLTHDDVPFDWSVECQKSFESCKKLLASNQLIVHFDPSKPIVLLCDASPVGVGAVLCHQVNVNGKLVEKPIMYVSATLTPTQQNYAQVDREGLAVIFAVTKVHRFVWGRKFTIVTDNAAIQRILHPDKGLPTRTGHRLQHWACTLQGYDYTIVHRKAQYLVAPDTLSRMPSSQVINSVSYVTPVINVSVITVDKIAEETAKDPVLKKVLLITHKGWSDSNEFKDNRALSVYFKYRDALAIVDKCLMVDTRVVIPASLQGQMLDILHQGHAGVVRTKLLARTTVWWPTINLDIESKCAQCVECAKVNLSSEPTLIPWSPAKFPFHRVHIDFFCYLNYTFLIFCDAYSKWLNVSLMNNTKARNVCNVLGSVFSQWGSLPQIVVSDNGPPFHSDEYVQFLTKLNIVVKYAPVYHPESNGLAERSVQVVKKALRKTLDDKQVYNALEITGIIHSFLFSYHNTPSTVTLKTPMEMLLTFRTRSALSQCNPKLNSPELSLALFKEGEVVWVKFDKLPVVKGFVIKQVGPTRFLVNIEGVIKQCHVNQISRCPL